MSTVQLEQPYRTTAEISHQLGNHPSAPVRWIVKGALLSNGHRLKLQAVRTPGGWRIRQDWLDAFLEALTVDRQSNSDTPDDGARGRVRSSAKRRAELAAVDAKLAAHGF